MRASRTVALSRPRALQRGVIELAAQPDLAPQVVAFSPARRGRPVAAKLLRRLEGAIPTDKPIVHRHGQRDTASGPVHRKEHLAYGASVGFLFFESNFLTSRRIAITFNWTTRNFGPRHPSQHARRTPVGRRRFETGRRCGRGSPAQRDPPHNQPSCTTQNARAVFRRDERYREHAPGAA
jgi:hypothetical protein